MISCQLSAASNKQQTNTWSERCQDNRMVAPFVISTGTFPSLHPVQPPPVHVCATESYDAACCTASLESAASALCRPTIYAPVAGEQKPPSGEEPRPIASPNRPPALLSLEDSTTDTGQANPTGCISAQLYIQSGSSTLTGMSLSMSCHLIFQLAA
jgi:hypothetical protein